MARKERPMDGKVGYRTGRAQRPVKQLMLWLDQDMSQWLFDRAKSERRSMTSQVLFLLEGCMRKEQEKIRGFTEAIQAVGDAQSIEDPQEVPVPVYAERRTPRYK